MGQTKLKNLGSPNKYGVVYVYNPDRTLNRSFRVTRAQMDAVWALPNGIPPGVTQDEWEGNRAVMVGRGLDVGDIWVEPNGDIACKVADQQVGDKLQEVQLRISAADYTGTFPDITVSQSALAALDLSATPLASIDSIVNGVVTWQLR